MISTIAEIPGIKVYSPPIRQMLDRHGNTIPPRVYGLGSDPAEGLPHRDDSSADVLDYETGEQVCHFSGKFEPYQFGEYIDAVGRYYNNAPTLVERNNHGHAVIGWLREHSQLLLLAGEDTRAGWVQSEKSKATLFDKATDMFRHSQVIVHDFKTLTQLQDIEASTLRAPEGLHDDAALSFVLACMAILKLRQQQQHGQLWAEPLGNDDSGDELQAARAALDHMRMMEQFGFPPE